MTVQSVQFQDSSNTVYVAVIDGITMYVPVSGVVARDAYITTMVSDWIKAGGIVAPAPAPSNTQIAQGKYANALSTVNVTWTTSNSLNGTYAVDSGTQFNVTAETVSILQNNTMTNGTSSRLWHQANGNFVTINTTQFKKFATAVASYVDSIQMAYANTIANSATVWPSANLSITG